jgi:hypothetical protein
MRRMFAAAALVVGLSPLVACGGETDDGVLRQVARGTTVCIDGWDEEGDAGDRAVVERKPRDEKLKEDAWVVPIAVPFRYPDAKDKCGGNFDVKVYVLPRGGYRVMDMGATKVGYDHDNCLEEGEGWAEIDPKVKLNWDPQDKEAGDASNDDCERDPARDAA